MRLRTRAAAEARIITVKKFHLKKHKNIYDGRKILDYFISLIVRFQIHKCKFSNRKPLFPCLGWAVIIYLMFMLSFLYCSFTVLSNFSIQKNKTKVRTRPTRCGGPQRGARGHCRVKRLLFLRQIKEAEPQRALQRKQHLEQSHCR